MITSQVDRENNYTMVAFSGTLPVRPTKYASVNFLMLGEITVPWPEGMTAEQALMEWKRNG